MTQLVFTNGAIVTPAGRVNGKSVYVDDTLIADISDKPIQDETVIDLEGGTLVPGFIDIQVNGGGGILFNDVPSVDTIEAIATAHRQYGTTGMLPTLISDDLSVIDMGMRAVEQAIRQGIPGILGIHIEGPFLSKAKKGVHNPDTFRTLDYDAIALLSSLSDGVTHVTLAPEKTTPEHISQLASTGVIISMGHTNADYETANTALDAGITGFTHLFNAMSGMESRAPGVVGAALAHTDSYAGIIVDGFHVHPASLKAAIHAKSAGRIMLVSDAMPSVGAREKSFMLQGRKVVVKGGKATITDGTLAGSDLDMASAVRNSVQMLDQTLENASQMASGSPAAFLGLEKTTGSISPGKCADLVLLDTAMQVSRVWISGKEYKYP